MLNTFVTRIKRFALAEAGALDVGDIVGLIMSILVIVVGILMAPVVLDQAGFARGNANIGNFAGTQAIVDLIPLLYAVGVLGLAGGIAFVVIKRRRS